MKTTKGRERVPNVRLWPGLILLGTLLNLSGCFDTTTPSDDGKTLDDFSLSSNTANTTGGDSVSLGLSGTLDVNAEVTDLVVQVLDSNGLTVSSSRIAVTDSLPSGVTVLDLSDVAQITVTPNAYSGSYTVTVTAVAGGRIYTSPTETFTVIGPDQPGVMGINDFSLSKSSSTLSSDTDTVLVSGEVWASVPLSSVTLSVVDAEGDTASGMVSQTAVSGVVSQWDLRSEGNMLILVGPNTPPGTYSVILKTAVQETWSTHSLSLEVVQEGSLTISDLDFTVGPGATVSETDTLFLLGTISANEALTAVNIAVEDSLGNSPLGAIVQQRGLSGNASLWNLAADGQSSVLISGDIPVGAYRIIVTATTANDEARDTIDFEITRQASIEISNFSLSNDTSLITGMETTILVSGQVNASQNLTDVTAEVFDESGNEAENIFVVQNPLPGTTPAWDLQSDGEVDILVTESAAQGTYLVILTSTTADLSISDTLVFEIVPPQVLTITLDGSNATTATAGGNIPMDGSISGPSTLSINYRITSSTPAADTSRLSVTANIPTSNSVDIADDLQLVIAIPVNACNGDYTLHFEVESGGIQATNAHNFTVTGGEDCSSDPLYEDLVTLGAQNATVGGFLELDNFEVHTTASAGAIAAAIDLVFAYSTSQGTAAIYSPEAAANGIGGSAGFAYVQDALGNSARVTRIKVIEASDYDEAFTSGDLQNLWSTAQEVTDGRLIVSANSAFIAQSSEGLLVAMKVTALINAADGTVTLLGAAAW